MPVRTRPLIWLAFIPTLAGAQTRVGDGAPQTTTGLGPDTARYVVLNHGRPTGEMEVVSAGDSVAVRFHYVDRGAEPRHLTTYHLDAKGNVLRLERSGVGVVPGPAEVTERFRRENGVAQWSSPGDSGRAPARSAAVYHPRTPTAYDLGLLARALLQRSDRTVPLLPSGSARLELAADTTLLVNGVPHRLRLAVIEGIPLGPRAVWLDAGGQVLASSSTWFITVRRGAESVLPAFRAIEMADAARRAESLARRLTVPVNGPIVIRNANVFDSERGVVLPRTTVVVAGDRIVAVGPADSVRSPGGATVIDATGKTVLPGLWDMHTHSAGPLAPPLWGLLWLGAGITTVRDLAGDADLLVSSRERARAGTLLSPRFLLAGFIEGPGRRAGPSEVIVSTEEAALAWVARYDSLGYRQIKLYHLVHPDLVSVIAAEAHRRGMRLSGHIPRGLSIPAALHLGFDEIQHASALFATFFPDSFYMPRVRLSGAVARAVAPTFDVDSPEMTALIGLLRERGTVIDGTFNLYEDRTRPLPDGTDPVFGPTLAWHPQLLRRFQLPGPASAEQSARARAASASYRRLLKRLFDAGVTLVAGTDNMPGLSYHGELEIYQRAGIPAASVLQIATIVPARVMGEEREYGSIAPGKVADLVIVDGRPDQDIRHLRRTERVMRGGKLYRSVDLYRAAGLTPPDHGAPR